VAVSGVFRRLNQQRASHGEEVNEVKKDLPAAVVYLIIAVVVVLVVGIGYKLLGPKGYDASKKAWDAPNPDYKKTGEVYKAPPGVPGITAPQNPPTGR
jgi:hypothetical protein